MCWNNSKSIELKLNQQNVISSNEKSRTLEGLFLQNGTNPNPNPRSTEKIASKIRKRPTSISELRSLLGLIGYFRRSISNFSQTVKPLYKLLKEKEHKQGSKQKIEWKDDHQVILDKLLTYLTEPPILAYQDFDLPFILHTEASGAGLRSGHFQIQDGSTRVIGYGSRTLNESEEKHHSSKAIM